MPYDANGDWYDELPPGYQGGGADMPPPSPPAPPVIDYPPSPYQITLDEMYGPEGTHPQQPPAWQPPPPVEAQPIPEPQPPPPMMRSEPPVPGEGYAKFTGQGWVPQDAPGAPQPPPQNEQQARQGNTFKMEFRNPYTGKGGFLNVPNNKEGQQLYNDYVRRGYEVRFPQHDQQAQQQAGPQGPPNVQDLLAKTQLTVAEQAQLKRYETEMAAVMADPRISEIAKSRMVRRYRAAMEPLERRQEMEKQLTMRQQAEDKKNMAKMDAEAVAERAMRFNELIQKNPNMVMRVPMPDGTTIIRIPTPDGKHTEHVTKSPNDLARERLDFQREQADERAKRQKEAEDAKAAKIVPFDEPAQEKSAITEAKNLFREKGWDIYEKKKDAQGNMVPGTEHTRNFETWVAKFYNDRKAQHEAGQRANRERGQQSDAGQPQPQPSMPPGNAKAELDAIVKEHGNIANIKNPAVAARALELYRIVQGGR